MRQIRNTPTASAFYVRPTPLTEAEKAEFGNRKRIVRMPELNGAIMPLEGAWVQPTDYWHQALREGSVERCSAPVDAAPVAAPAIDAPAPPRPRSTRAH